MEYLQNLGYEGPLGSREPPAMIEELKVGLPGRITRYGQADRCVVDSESFPALNGLIENQRGIVSPSLSADGLAADEAGELSAMRASGRASGKERGGSEPRPAVYVVGRLQTTHIRLRRSLSRSMIPPHSTGNAPGIAPACFARAATVQSERPAVSMATRAHTTELLLESRGGQRAAFDALFEEIYDELRQIAHRHLARRSGGETLGTTALVHEAYLRLVDSSRVQWVDRAHFLALASRAIRYVLIDYARSRAAAKRGGLTIVVTLAEAADPIAVPVVELLALNDALDELGRFSDRLRQVVECRFFGGMTYDEIAAVTATSVPTVKRDWQRARAWLVRLMETPAPDA
jgi:RNA polymerase sigma factor (TIGR02999 family)